MIRIGILVPGFAAAWLAGERDLSGYSFRDYIAEFAKQYDDDVFESRKAGFESNFKSIQEHNSNSGKSWFATVNKFSDMTSEEYRSFVKGRVPEPRTMGSAASAWTSDVSLDDLPARLDWREKNKVSPVKDQGGCGSCWAFSAVESLESHLAIATSEEVMELSPQQVVSCSQNPQHCGGTGGCKGSTQPLAFNYTQFAGMTKEVDYPYKQVNGVCDPRKINPVGYNTGGYVKLPVNDYTALMTAVATKGPVSISVAATNMQFYGGGILGNCNDFVMNHAVQLVGYGSDNGTDYWLVRNSWGSWGEEGYIRVQRHGQDQEPCGKDGSPKDGEACDGDKTQPTYCGECGILSSSSYPVGLSKLAPPTPPSPPTPAPMPATHYGRPPCGEDEMMVIVVDEGMVCAARCDTDDDCPTDTPAGVWKAKPKCGLIDEDTSARVCYLHCSLGLGCGKGQSCFNVVNPDGSVAEQACAYLSSEAKLVTV